uniref:Uncharacterized protein n=1 Tax=Amphimedon queenslandica TaxID=400682 RepID=A0A1X7VCE6_AMPQE
MEDQARSRQIPNKLTKQHWLSILRYSLVGDFSSQFTFWKTLGGAIPWDGYGVLNGNKVHLSASLTGNGSGNGGNWCLKKLSIINNNMNN